MKSSNREPPIVRARLDGTRGDTNVIKVWIGIDQSGIACASVLSRHGVREELRALRRHQARSLTRQPIANDAPEWEPDADGRVMAPELRRRMAMKGRLARIAAAAPHS